MSDFDLEAYDAGLLSDHGGGNAGWWQDYIRAELGRAHEFYVIQIAALRAATASPESFGVSQDEPSPTHAEATATEAQHAGQWRPIESAPRDGTEIIVNVPVWRGGFIVAAAHWVPHDDHGGDWWWANESSGDYYASPIHDDHGEPTHWQPLPVPPAAPPSPAPPSSEREGSRAGNRYLDAEGKAP